MLYSIHIQFPVVRLRRFIWPKFSQTSHKPFSHALKKLSTVDAARGPEKLWNDCMQSNVVVIDRPRHFNNLPKREGFTVYHTCG